MTHPRPSVPQMPTQAPMPTAERPADRSAELRLARLHLRMGVYALARAELETLAGDGALDEEALLDLAEIRWRTDDLTGAGEAAAAYLASGREALVALVIACEATAALGRPAEARRLAGRALELAGAPLDALFAGISRSSVWPSETPERTEPFIPAQALGAPIGSTSATAGDGLAPAAPEAGVGAGIDGSEAMPDPSAELAAARAALASGDRTSAAIRLAVVLRFAPVLAPAVLDVAATEPGPAFDLVRGDALRLVGHETQARRAYAAAAARLAPDVDRAAVDSTPEEGS